MKAEIIELSKKIPYAVDIKPLLDKVTELELLAEIGRLTEKLLETGSMQHRFKYLDDIRSVEQLIEWGKDK